MYKGIQQTEDYLKELVKLTSDISRDEIELFIIPSYTSLERVGKTIDQKYVKLGAQNMCWEEQGQFTGEISPLMLRETGCDLVMIGHSERRHIFGETDEMERKKVRCALDHDLTALLCVGETEAEKDSGEADAVLERQLSIGLADIGAAETEKIWIAYEPVWAIGVQGKPITFAYADERLYKIRQALKALFGEAGEQIPIFYGGSVNPGNALELAACREINGLFIGRSAWDAEAFNVLIRKVLNR